MWWGITLLAAVGGVVWAVAERRERRERRDERDEAELLAAEDEVRDLDAMATPEDADDQLPDWGPGASGR
jgi:hypothetical protein